MRFGETADGGAVRMTRPLTLPEIRARLGLDDRNAYVLEQLRDAYAKSRHAPLMLTGLHGPEPFTVEVALAYGNRVARTELG